MTTDLPQSGSMAPDLPFRYIAGDPALDLVNTVDWTSSGPAQDRLNDYIRLTRWAEGAGLLSPQDARSLRTRADARPGEAAAAHRLALRLREVLNRLFGAIAREKSPGKALTEFNELLGSALERMQVVPAAGRHPRGKAFELGWRERGQVLESVIWPVLWSAATLAVSGEASSIRICGGADCGWMYVDRSRNRLRRWCQMATCGTREKSRRRYARS